MTARRIFDRTLRIAALSTAILAAGCGGGGGGSSPPPPIQPQLIQITVQNQDAVARATVATFFSMTGVRALPLAPSPSPRALATGVNDLAMHALSKAMAPAPVGSKVSRLEVYSDTAACTMGGSMTLTIDDRDNNLAISRGDVMTIAFSQCRETADSMINGALVMAIANASETANSVQLSGTFTYQQLTIIDAGYTSTVNGAMDSVYSESIDPMTGTLNMWLESTVASGGVVASGSTPLVSDTFTYDAGFRSQSNEVTPGDPNAIGFSTIALNGTVHVGSLGGRITLVMDPMWPVHEQFNAEYPDSGRVTVLGSASQLRLTVLNAERVRQELDANNDGTFEANKEVLWTELLP
jgi:hypothetical protein